jgi:hypothetical protein
MVRIHVVRCKCGRAARCWSGQGDRKVMRLPRGVVKPPIDGGVESWPASGSAHESGVRNTRPVVWGRPSHCSGTRTLRRQRPIRSRDHGNAQCRGDSVGRRGRCSCAPLALARHSLCICDRCTIVDHRHWCTTDNVDLSCRNRFTVRSLVVRWRFPNYPHRYFLTVSLTPQRHPRSMLDRDTGGGRISESGPSDQSKV